MKKVLKKKSRKVLNAVRYFSGELIRYKKQEKFSDGTWGTCWYNCP